MIDDTRRTNLALTDAFILFAIGIIFGALIGFGLDILPPNDIDMVNSQLAISESMLATAESYNADSIRMVITADALRDESAATLEETASLQATIAAGLNIP